MKKLIFNLFFIFIFILNFTVLPSIAQSMHITSVSFDDSAAFLTINSYDNYNVMLEPKPEINIDEENKKAYFDLQPAKLSGVSKSYIINSENIKEINLSQISEMPDIVRVSISYNDNYNPADINLQKLNNTLFLKFKNPVLNNYYFQEIYKESPASPLFENTVIHQKLSRSKNTIGEINSAFTSNNNSDKEEVLTTKDLILKTKYYIDSITVKGSIPIFYGIGTYTLLRPVYLSSPNRAVFDIKNAIVNPVLRNKTVPIGSDTVKIGQFDHNTARIVINSAKSERYIPVIYGDTQKLAILNTGSTSPLNLYSSVVDMTGVSGEKGDKSNFSMKLIFSNPLVLGVNRLPDKLELYLYNVNNYYGGAIKSELRNTPFENIEMSDIKSGGAKLTLPLKSGDEADIYFGGNGKTLRMKVHTKNVYKPTPEKVEQEVKVPAITVPAATVKRKSGKRYVVIDAGHGGSDYGALRNGINEKDITLDISKRVQKLLEKKGYVVAMTRTNDTYVSLKGRVEFSEAFNPDIFVSIHVNSSNSESPTGLETHYYKDNSLYLAKCIHAAMLNNINSKNRGLFKSRFYVINHTTAPAVLVEIGFISNPWERGQMVTEARKNATAKAIVEGIDEYFRRK